LTGDESPPLRRISRYTRTEACVRSTSVNRDENNVCSCGARIFAPKHPEIPRSGAQELPRRSCSSPTFRDWKEPLRMSSEPAEVSEITIPKASPRLYRVGALSCQVNHQRLDLLANSRVGILRWSPKGGGDGRPRRETTEELIEVVPATWPSRGVDFSRSANTCARRRISSQWPRFLTPPLNFSTAREALKIRVTQTTSSPGPPGGGSSYHAPRAGEAGILLRERASGLAVQRPAFTQSVH